MSLSSIQAIFLSVMTGWEDGMAAGSVWFWKAFWCLMHLTHLDTLHMGHGYRDG